MTKDAVIQIRVGQAEKERIDQRAKDAGMKTSAWIRERLLGELKDPAGAEMGADLRAEEGSPPPPPPPSRNTLVEFSGAPAVLAGHRGRATRTTVGTHLLVEGEHEE